MKISALATLVCPDCGGALRLEAVSADTAGEVLSGVLRCPNSHAYPVIHGVPKLLNDDEMAPGQLETRDSFSAKWEHTDGYREDTRFHYEPWFLQRYGLGTLERLADLLEGATRILDAGTGHGRDAEMYATAAPGAEVFGIDISDGIRLAYTDLGGRSNLHLVQADLTRLPFLPETFDFIGCDQVIHHTPDTRRSLGVLVSRLKPGGRIAFYVYRVKAPLRELIDDWIRERTTQMSVAECLEFSEQITDLGRALTRLEAVVDIPRAIPLLGIPAGPIDVQRLIYWFFLKCYWNEGMSVNSNVMTNFDWYHPLHAHRHTPDEVRLWCNDLGLQIEHFDVVESGISVLARRA